ncbi:MAG: protein kinase [Polyangiales bacterium]
MTLLRPGDVVGDRYRVLHPIARGGMGAVFEAEDTQLRRRVALKVLLPAFASDVDALERFRREALAVASVKHEGLVDVYDVALDGTPPYLIMELVDGESLRDVLAVRGRLPLGETLGLVADVLDTLSALHAAGIVHRDLKPANVLLVRGPKGQRAKLIDLGVAQVDDAGDTLTATDVAVGTPAYMAPEQLAGHRVGPAADLWAAGVLLHTLLTGARPFAATTLAELVAASAPLPLRPLRESCPDAPDALDACVARLLHPDPRERPMSAAAVAHELRTLVGVVGGPSDAFGVAPLGTGDRDAPTVGASATPRVGGATQQTRETPTMGATPATGATPRIGGTRRAADDVGAPHPHRRVRVWAAALTASALGGLVFLSLGSREPSPHGAPPTAEEPRPPSAASSMASTAPPFVYRPPDSHVVVLFGSVEEQAAVATLVEGRVTACFPSSGERRLGFLAAYTVRYEADGQVVEVLQGTRPDQRGSRTDAEDACVQSVLRDTAWPTAGLEPSFGRYRVTVSVAALPPGAQPVAL